MSAIKCNCGNNERGVVLIVCLILLLMLSLIGIASITTSNSDMQVAGNEMNQTGAFYAAESGIEKAAASIATCYETTALPPNPLPSGSVAQGIYRNAYSTTDNGSPVSIVLSDGSYKGLYGTVKSFTVSSNGIDTVKRESGVSLTMQMQDALIPIFQFAIFYQNDLEFSPTANMTLAGRIHSNGDIYIQTSARFEDDSYMTSAESILHGAKAGSGLSTLNGDVFIKDGSGVIQNMKNLDGTWLDATPANWVNGSLGRWGGLIEDHNMGITQLNMPVVRSGATTNLIDPSNGGANSDSYENKAGLKIIDGVVKWKDASGNWQVVTASFTGVGGVMDTSVFYDARENKNVRTFNIDIGKLNLSPYWPSNGIIYCSRTAGTTTVNAFRLKNGGTLKTALTVATNNPLYTQGNFNTTSKKPACLMADAITVLSGSWDDTKSSGPLSGRVAAATAVNASYITGNIPTGQGGQAYSGGFENLMRMLEKWDGITFTWSGSGSNLWNSRQATSPYLSPGTFYTAPNRAFSFDASLLNSANLPPGTPFINIVQRTQWSQAVYHP